MKQAPGANYDVIIVGAGFAGATAARELATRGLRTLVLEANDRPGGRTHTVSLSDDEIVELGGTYVHWMQPHTWSELSRYGMTGDLIRDEIPEVVLAPSADGLEWTAAKDYAEREERLMTDFFAGSQEIIPRPYDPGFAREQVARADGKTIAARLDQMDLIEPDRAFLEAFFGCHTTVPAEQGSYLTEVRWWAPSGHRFASMQESVWTYRLARGMRPFLEAILADGGADVRYNAYVKHIHTRGDTTIVTTQDGQSHTSRAVVIATPAGVWPDIDINPPLHPDLLAAAVEGLQAEGGSKGFAVVRGEPRAIHVQPRSGHPLGALWTKHRRSADEQVMVYFGNPKLGDGTDLQQVSDAIGSLLPHVEVVEVVGRNYVHADPTLRGGWSVMKPGQFTKFELHKNSLTPEGRIAFATSDIATGWAGYIDGAIEAGIVAARQVRASLDT